MNFKVGDRVRVRYSPNSPALPVATIIRGRYYLQYNAHIGCVGWEAQDLILVERCKPDWHDEGAVT
jgi:hypothetical protein